AARASASVADGNAGSDWPEPVGAATGPGRRGRIAGQAWRGAAAAPGNARVNQAATAGWKPSSAGSRKPSEGGAGLAIGPLSAGASQSMRRTTATPVFTRRLHAAPILGRWKPTWSRHDHAPRKAAAPRNPDRRAPVHADHRRPGAQAGGEGPAQRRRAGLARPGQR